MNIKELFSGGDRRSIGNSDKVVKLVLRDRSKFDEVFNAMADDDPIVRMRAADAAEKITATYPELLARHKKQLLNTVAAIPQQEVRWHVCQMLPRLELTARERARAIIIVKSYLDDKSGIVRTFAMQALYDLSANDTKLRAEILALIQHLTTTGTPAVRSRGKKLLALANNEKKSPAPSKKGGKG